MSMISFAWTTSALVNGGKTETWRDWNHRYASQFRAGRYVDAWDRSPRNHGVKVAKLRLTHDATFTCSREVPKSFYETEGLQWYHDHPEMWPKTIFGQPFTGFQVSPERFALWRASGHYGWVVSFEVLEIYLPAANRYLLPERRIDP